jgi:hypothetical protein
MLRYSVAFLAFGACQLTRRSPARAICSHSVGNIRALYEFQFRE